MNAVSIIGVFAAFGFLLLSLLAFCAEKGMHPLGRIRNGFRRLPGWKKVLILIFVSVWIAFAGTKDGTNGVDQVEGETNTVTQVEGGTNQMENGELRIDNAGGGFSILRSPFSILHSNAVLPGNAITGDDIERMFRVATTFDVNSFAEPTANAVTNAAAYIVCRGTDRYRREPCLPVGEVGGAVLMTTNYVGPMHVSFEGIMLAEIPCSDVIPPEGYYATTNYTDSFSHTKKAGAGWTRRVSPGNYWTVDMAGTYSSYANWSPGRMEWKIPIGWFRFFEGNPVDMRIEVPEYEECGNTKSRQLFINNPDTYRQTFTIDGNGTFKIEKHGHWLSRSTNCVMTLDGRVIQERHP